MNIAYETEYEYGSARQVPSRKKNWLLLAVLAVVAAGLLFLPTFWKHRNELPEGLIQQFEIAFTRHDLEACLALFADDAQILPQHGATVTGRDNLADFLKNSMTPVVSFNTDTDMLLVRGDIAVEQGHFTVRNIRRGANIELGKYMHVWRKQHGEWKLYRMIYNTDVAPKGEATVAGELESAN